MDAQQWEARRWVASPPCSARTGWAFFALLSGANYARDKVPDWLKIIVGGGLLFLPMGLVAGAFWEYCFPEGTLAGDRMEVGSIIGTTVGLFLGCLLVQLPSLEER